MKDYPHAGMSRGSGPVPGADNTKRAVLAAQLERIIERARNTPTLEWGDEPTTCPVCEGHGWIELTGGTHELAGGRLHIEATVTRPVYRRCSCQGVETPTPGVGVRAAVGVTP